MIWPRRFFAAGLAALWLSASGSARQNIFQYFVAPAGPGNRRNSEADVLRLKDGRLLLAWTR